jgi:hypothetical protein
MDPRVSLTPELAQDRVIGALGVGDLAGRSFGAEEIEIVRAFADQAAIVRPSACRRWARWPPGVTHYVNNVLQGVLGCWPGG